MNTLTIALFACLVVFATAKPGGIWGGHAGALWGGHGAAVHAVHAVPAGPTTLIGASGVVGPNGAVGPTGAVNGHGAVGPNGIPNAVGHAGLLGAPVVVGGLGHLGGWAHDDGQWHGEGLLESQDFAGHGAAVIAPGFYGAHHGLGHGAHW